KGPDICLELTTKYEACLNSTNIQKPSNPWTKEGVELMCKTKLLDCAAILYKCPENVNTLKYQGLSFKSLREAYSALCKRINEYIPCTHQPTQSNKISETAAKLHGDLIMKFIKKEITDDVFFKKICPIAKNTADGFLNNKKCPQKYNEIMHNFHLMSMSDQCKSITGVDNGSQRVSFKVSTTSISTKGPDICLELTTKYEACLNSTNIQKPSNPWTKEGVELMCKTKFLDCAAILYKCPKNVNILKYQGSSFKSLREAYSALCKRINEYIPCTHQPTQSNKISETAAKLHGDLITKFIKKEITDDVFFKKICPIAKNTADGFLNNKKCPQKYNEIMHNFHLMSMSDQCKSITGVDNGSQRVSFKGGLMYFSFVVIFILHLI
ncbi:hypothetical protein Ahia01_001343800, partial [Argonauta hians]